MRQIVINEALVTFSIMINTIEWIYTTAILCVVCVSTIVNANPGKIKNQRILLSIILKLISRLKVDNILPYFIYKFSLIVRILISVSTTEEYTVIEDDMILYDDGSDYQGEFLSAQKRRWPKTGNEVNIPFTKRSTFASQEKDIALQKAIDEFETKTCIR